MISEHGLVSFLDTQVNVRVTLKGSRKAYLIGKIKGFDEYMNITLKDAYKIIFVPEKNEDNKITGHKKYKQILDDLVLMGDTVLFIHEEKETKR